MDTDGLSSRDKNDIFWAKKRKYLVSAAIKNRKAAGFLNPDTALEVREAYQKLDKNAFKKYLTGYEFSDHPPLASGQSSFAASIAEMMHLLDYLETMDPKDLDREAFSDYFLETFEEGKTLIREIVDAFFPACGVDREGNPISSSREKRAAQDAFFQKRTEYERLIRTQNQIAGCSMMDDIRLKNGIDERMKTDIDITDPAFEKLVEEHQAEYVNRKEEIEKLRSVGRAAFVEAAERIRARRALEEVVTRITQDPATDELSRRVLRDAYLNDSFDVNLHLRRLLYRKEAAYYQARWILTGEPVDAVIGEVIAEISSEKPRLLDGDKVIHEIPGFAEPKEEAASALPAPDDLKAVFAVGDEIQGYLTKHPEQFESQCLLSVITGTEELPGILGKSWALACRIDRLTLDGQVREIPEEEKRRLLDVWVLADKVCRIGHMIMGFVSEIRDKTVEEGTRILRDALPNMSFSATEQKAREALNQIFTERCG